MHMYISLQNVHPCQGVTLSPIADSIHHIASTPKTMRYAPKLRVKKLNIMTEASRSSVDTVLALAPQPCKNMET